MGLALIVSCLPKDRKGVKKKGQTEIKKTEWEKTSFFSESEKRISDKKYTEFK